MFRLWLNIEPDCQEEDRGPDTIIKAEMQIIPSTTRALNHNSNWTCGLEEEGLMFVTVLQILCPLSPPVQKFCTFLNFTMQVTTKEIMSTPRVAEEDTCVFLLPSAAYPNFHGLHILSI